MHMFSGRKKALAALIFAFCAVLALCTVALAVSEGWTKISDSATCEYKLENNTLSIRPLDNGASGSMGDAAALSPYWPWYNARLSITQVIIYPGVKTGAKCNNMFENFRAESLDLSNLDTSDATDMTEMFYNCNTLKTIFVDPEKWSTEKVARGSGGNMFHNCKQLVGGAGTTYDSNNKDQLYARVDGGPDSATPGYLTAKTEPEPTPAPVPTTGDNTPIALTAGLLALSGIALIALKKHAAR